MNMNIIPIELIESLSHTMGGYVKAQINNVYFMEFVYRIHDIKHYEVIKCKRVGAIFQVHIPKKLMGIFIERVIVLDTPFVKTNKMIFVGSFMVSDGQNKMHVLCSFEN